MTDAPASTTAQTAALAADLDNLATAAALESAAWKLNLPDLTVQQYALIMGEGTLEILEELAVTRATTHQLAQATRQLGVTDAATAYADAAASIIGRSRDRQRRAFPTLATIDESCS